MCSHLLILMADDNTVPSINLLPCTWTSLLQSQETFHKLLLSRRALQQGRAALLTPVGRRLLTLHGRLGSLHSGVNVAGGARGNLALIAIVAGQTCHKLRLCPTLHCSVKMHFHLMHHCLYVQWLVQLLVHCR